MTRRDSDSVAPLRRGLAGWMPASMGRLSAGVGRRHLVTICKVVVDGGVDEAGMSTAAPGRSAVLYGWMHQSLGGCSQACC